MIENPPFSLGIYHCYVDLLLFAVVFWTVPQSFSYVGVLNKFSCFKMITYLLFGCLDVIHESLMGWNAKILVIFTDHFAAKLGEDLNVQLQAPPLIILVWVKVTTSWVTPTEKKNGWTNYTWIFTALMGWSSECFTSFTRPGNNLFVYIQTLAIKVV